MNEIKTFSVWTRGVSNNLPQLSKNKESEAYLTTYTENVYAKY